MLNVRYKPFISVSVSSIPDAYHTSYILCHRVSWSLYAFCLFLFFGRGWGRGRWRVRRHVLTLIGVCVAHCPLSFTLSLALSLSFSCVRYLRPCLVVILRCDSFSLLLLLVRMFVATFFVSPSPCLLRSTFFVLFRLVCGYV